jgi:hypothetical protein
MNKGIKVIVFALLFLSFFVVVWNLGYKWGRYDTNLWWVEQKSIYYDTKEILRKRLLKKHNYVYFQKAAPRAALLFVQTNTETMSKSGLHKLCGPLFLGGSGYLLNPKILLEYRHYLELTIHEKYSEFLHNRPPRKVSASWWIQRGKH